MPVLLDPTKPKVFVVGKTRNGKGMAIQTAVFRLTGQVIEIASARMESHTKCAAGYVVTINGRIVELVDTVGYDDTEDDSVSEREFLKMLECTGTAPYYPPWVIIREMAGTDVAWVKKIRSVFPCIVIAVRGCSELFEQAQEFFADPEYAGVRVFHLLQFVDAKYDNGATRKIYEEGVDRILEHYGTLEPSREELDFDARIFQGEIEQVKIRSETKTEERVEESLITTKEGVVVKKQEVRTVNNGGHYEDRKVKRDTGERVFSTIVSIAALGSAGWSSTRTERVWVKDTKEIVVDVPTIEQVDVQYVKRSVFRLTFERDHYEVWKVLAGGVRIFKEYAQSDWKKIKEELADVTQTKAGR